MAFLEKLGGFAKNIGDKTSDAIETGKLNNKITAEKAAINELLRQIGSYYYQKHQDGVPDDPDAVELLTTIDNHNNTIAELQADIERIKAEAEAASAAPVVEEPTEVLCPACGAENKPGTKFCRACGAAVPQPAVEAAIDASIICPDCGAENKPGTKFCRACGVALAAAAPAEVVPEIAEEAAVAETIAGEPAVEAIEEDAVAAEVVVEEVVVAVVSEESVVEESVATDASIVCPDCGAENKPGTKFCRACGVALAAAAPAAAVPEIAEEAAVVETIAEEPAVEAIEEDAVAAEVVVEEAVVAVVLEEPVVEEAVAIDASIVCPDCGAENKPGTKFCRACGVALAAAAPAEVVVEAVVQADIITEETAEVIVDEPAIKTAVVEPVVYTYTAPVSAEPVVYTAPAVEAAPVATPTPEGITCAACGAVNPVGTKFCRSCGKGFAAPPPAPVAPESRFCPNCGTKNAATSRFCGSCGHKFA